MQVSQWERGEWLPRPQTLDRLAEMYGKTPAALRYGTGAGEDKDIPSPAGGLPPLAPDWRGSPHFWVGVQWALRGLMGRMTELQDAVLEHGVGAMAGSPAPPAVANGVGASFETHGARVLPASEYLKPARPTAGGAAEAAKRPGGKRRA